MGGGNHEIEEVEYDEDLGVGHDDETKEPYLDRLTSEQSKCPGADLICPGAPTQTPVKPNTAASNAQKVCATSPKCVDDKSGCDFYGFVKHATGCLTRCGELFNPALKDSETRKLNLE